MGTCRYCKKSGSVISQTIGFCADCIRAHFKDDTFAQMAFSAEKLAQAVDDKTACICYFGGDPTPQILHAIKTALLADMRKEENILRICWETNGAMKETYLKKIAEISMQSGGCIKFDLKAWNKEIHLALCGVPNYQTMKNFEKLAQMTGKRPEPPFLIASTLLVPGYVDEEEIAPIARFIAGLNPDIPYSLLGFYPHFYLKDLPKTSKDHTNRCKIAAEKEGLRQVNIGNIHLLS